MVNSINDNQAAKVTLLHVDIISVFTFWIKAIPRPVYGKKRCDLLTGFADRANQIAELQQDFGNWEVKPLTWTIDPAVPSSRLEYYVRAKLSGKDFLAAASSVLTSAQFRERHNSIVLSIRKCVLRYDDFGLGTVEHTIHFSSGDSQQLE